MTENANPKPLNISLMKCQRRTYKLVRTASLGLSINQSKDALTVKLAN